MEAYETLPIVPLRDVVVFPHMMMPFVVGRPSSTRALEHALSSDKRIFLAAQKDAANDDPNLQRHLHDGLRGEHRPEPAAAGRQRQGSRRGDRPRPDGGMEGRQGVLSCRREGARQAERRERGRRSGDEQGRVPVRAVRQAVEQPSARRHDRRRARRRPEQARRHDRRPSGHRRGREAEPARNHLAARTADAHRQHPRNRGRQAPGGSPHPVSREEADGEGAKGVLPQREDEGDPEGAGPQGGAGQRSGRVAQEDQ